MTAEEFWEWANRPENSNKRFELAAGEPVEMPPPGEQHGALCSWIAHLLWTFVVRTGAGGVASNDTGLLVQREPDTVRGPDVMLFSESLPLDALDRKFSSRVPSLVVEVLSPNDRWDQVNVRIGQYLRRGVPLVWVLHPETRTVTVYRPREIQQVRDETEEVSGEDVLPDLRFRVAELFTLPGR
jgi:Uma2 family endonuclease